MRLGAYQYTAGLLQLVIGHRPDEKSAPQTQSLVRFGSLWIALDSRAPAAGAQHARALQGKKPNYAIFNNKFGLVRSEMY